MHRGVYTNTLGQSFVFGEENLWQIKGTNGLPVNLTLSQGFNQIGQTADGASIKGATYTITGTFAVGNYIIGREQMSKVFSALSQGTLVIDDKYTNDVIVKTTPSFSLNDKDGIFSLQLFAPVPFFKTKSISNIDLQGITKEFRFPVNYGTPHRFGSKTSVSYKNLINSGTQPVPICVEFYADSTVSNLSIQNIETLEETRFTEATLQQGESLKMYTNSNNKLIVEKTLANGDIENVLYLLDEDSDLFMLDVGDNYIKGSAESGLAGLGVRVEYQERGELIV